MGGRDIGRIGAFGQIERHQGLERDALGQGRENPVAVGCGLPGGDDRRHEVGHDDGPGKVARGFGQHARQHRAVAQMQVHVVGTADREAVGHEGGASRSAPAFPVVFRGPAGTGLRVAPAKRAAMVTKQAGRDCTDDAAPGPAGAG